MKRNKRKTVFFFFTDTATPEIYPLSLHDALPIFAAPPLARRAAPRGGAGRRGHVRDRKSTRLNSSHVSISYAVFCLKKKKKRSYSRCRIRTSNFTSRRTAAISNV